MGCDSCNLKRPLCGHKRYVSEDGFCVAQPGNSLVESTVRTEETIREKEMGK